MRAENVSIELDAGVLELMDQLAGYLKYSAIYPRNNVRVKDTCAGFFAAFERVKVEHGSRIVIALEGNRFKVAGIPIVAETAVIAWARDAFTRTALGGIELDANVRRWSLAKFADRMRENCTFPDNTFNGFWGRDFPGIVPRELRYAGRSDQAAHRDRVIRSLMQNDGIMAKLEKLRGKLDEHLPPGESARINLLEPIRKALPIEAVLDPMAAAEIVEKIIEICESKVLAMVAKEEFTEHELMEVALAGIGRRYFKAHVKDMAAPPQDSLPEGRPEDASTIDSLDLMLAEYEALPRRERQELRIGGDDYAREALGVCVHALVKSDSEDPPAAGLIRKMLADDPEHAEILVPYVERCLTSAGLQEENRGLWRVIELLQEADPTGILTDRRFLVPDAVQFTFPRQFVPFVDSLPSDQSDELSKIADVCHGVGAERIEAAGEYLLGHANLVTRRRLQKILSVDSDELLPLVGVFAEVSDDWVRDSVARFIRRRDPPVKESAALRVVRPMIWLSPLYLQGLCVRDPSREHREWLQEESGRLLRVFLRNTTGMEDLMERRIRAVHMLSALPCDENLELLSDVIREQRFSFFQRGPRALRRAARKARKQTKRQLAKERR